MYWAALYFINWLAVSEAAPRLDPFGTVLHQRSEEEDRDIYCIYIFLFFQDLSVF